MDPQSDARQIADALRLVEREADSYLASLDTALVKPPMAAEASPIHRLPDHGTGSVAALEELVAAAVDGATRSAGPRFFHFVIGGVTPAALAADWLTSTLDQNAYNWVSSPFGSRMEQVTMSWLRELFGIPAGWSGVLTTDATIANFVGLASARRWWGLKHGVDIDADGWSGLHASPRRMAARRRRVRPVRGRIAEYASSAAWTRACRLGRSRRSQVAQRPVRRRLRVREGSGAARWRVLCERRLPRDRSTRATGVGNMAPEMSRRTRALTVWATLRAYGRSGIQAMVERHIRLAQRVAAQVDAAPDLERLAEVPLNVVCFRFRPAGVPEAELGDLNRALGARILEDGRVYFGTTDYAGVVAFRPAFVNWRTREEDVDLVVSVTRELGARLVAEGASA